MTLFSPAHAAEIVTLTESNWDAYAPVDKEVDAIYGDFVIRNDRITAVIGQTAPWRRANLTTPQVGGGLLDMTVRDRQNDQLTAFFPLARQFVWDQSEVHPAAGKRVTITCRTESSPSQPTAEVRYILEDGWDWLLIETEVSNTTTQPVTLRLIDEMRADRTFQGGADPANAMLWVEDPWFGQAYGVAPGDEKHTPRFERRDRPWIVGYGADAHPVTLEPGRKLAISRRVFCAAHSLGLHAAANSLRGVSAEKVELHVTDPAGPVSAAEVEVKLADDQSLWGKTDADGRLTFALPGGQYPVTVAALARTEQAFALKVDGPTKKRVKFDEPGYVVAKITDAKGGPIPCKVQFIGTDGTADPFFFPDSGEHAVHNCYYTHKGTFRQTMPPGRYRTIVSYGPEYDAVYGEIQVERGKETPFKAKLVRTVDTSGWISSDFHSHSSPSGDNTSSQFGRVLNLLAEHIEYAPCTEHNRVDSYTPHLQRLGVEHLLATSTGIELTGQPLPLNHQNAFPIIHKPRTQDGGGPFTDVDPTTQISRLALWDGGAEKLVQQNHPNLVQLLFDADLDGSPDEAYRQSLPYMDVIEVHPLHAIFMPAEVKNGINIGRNRIHTWLQMLNQGLHVPGVVNTDAHYNFHGSGWLRNYIKSPTDDPAKIRTLDIVRESEKGHVVMSNGPFMEVTLVPQSGTFSTPLVLPGDMVRVPEKAARLYVRVKCPNWLDVDCIQVLLNGRADPKLNFTRATHPELFSSTRVARFDQGIDLTLTADTHVIVVAVGENFMLGPVMGGSHAEETPIAVSNPIFVDVDGRGFQGNGDTLDAPLPR